MSIPEAQLSGIHNVFLRSKNESLGFLVKPGMTLPSVSVQPNGLHSSSVKFLKYNPTNVLELVLA